MTLAVLSREHDTVALDLYLNCTQQVSLLLKGAPKGTAVSLSGYFEPKGDDMDDEMFGYGQEDEEEDADDGDSDSDEEEGDGKNANLVVKGKAITKKQEAKQLSDSLKQAQQNRGKNSATALVNLTPWILTVKRRFKNLKTHVHNSSCLTKASG